MNVEEYTQENSDEEIVCTTSDDDSDGSEVGSSEVDVDEDDTTCLFCDKIFRTVELAMDHIDTDHNINFKKLKSKFEMDQYSFIKLINYIRTENIDAKHLEEANEVFWNDEKYLRPKCYETWLTYDYEELPSLPEDKPEHVEYNKKDLYSLINTLKNKINAQNVLLQQASEDMTKMRSGFKGIIEKYTSLDSNTKVPKNSNTSVKINDSYFEGYAHFGIHQEMLSDVVRTSSYRDALLKNQDFIRNKDVLDVGCGTSILSIFASQAGAKTVVGVDNSNIIYNAMDIVKKNKFDNIILVKGLLEDTVLPQDKFDIIISEWMGYFLLFEGMLDSVIYARDKYLKPGGMVLPNRCTMSIIGFGSDELYKSHIQFWDDVYGLNMSNMRKEIMHEPLIEILDPEHILTDPNEIANFDLSTVNMNYSNFSYNFNLKCKKDGKLSAFVGYFDTYFDLPHPIMFGTSPTDKPTHWKQVVFFLSKPQEVKAEDIITGKITCKRSRNNERSLDIIITAFGITGTYYLD